MRRRPSSSSALRALPIVGTADGELTLAIDTFLSQPDMTANTRRSYATTLRFIEREVGRGTADAPLLAAIVTQRWDDVLTGHVEPQDRQRRVVPHIRARAGSARCPRRTTAAPASRASRQHSLAPDREPRAPLAAPRDPDPRTHPLANALRDRCTRRRDPRHRRRGSRHPQQARSRAAPRAATTTSSSFRPEPRGYCRDCSPVESAARSSCRTSRRVPHAFRQAWTCALSPAGRACRTGAPRSSSCSTPAGRCTSFVIAP